MTYEELVRSVEAAAAQKNSEILQVAKHDAEEIIREAEGGATGIREKYQKGSIRKVAVERNRLIYLTNEKIKAEQSRILQEIYATAFHDAADDLKEISKSPRYPELFKKMLDEAILRAGRGELVLHINARDSEIGEKSLPDHGISEIIKDLECTGGVLLTSRDGKISIHNTFESRLEKAKEIYKLEIYKALTGD